VESQAIGFGPDQVSSREAAPARRLLLPPLRGSLAIALLQIALLGVVCSEAQLLTGRERSASAPGLYGLQTEPETLVPQRRRTGLPGSMYYERRWQGMGYTNYSRESYERYRSPYLEGLRYYDNFGAYVGQGWLVYDWTEVAPEPDGSMVDLGSEFTSGSRFSRWFNGIMISSASHGQYHSSLAISDQLRTSFTPLTFAKPRFNGIQWDVMSDKYAVTLLASRLSSPLQFESDYSSRFLAAHGEAQVGDFGKVGVTWANVHNTRADVSVADSPLSGVLTGPQNLGNVDEVTIVIADDSPGSPQSGAVLIVERVLVDGVFHPEIRPLISGGVSRQGYLEVSGPDVIELTYNIRDDFRPTDELGSHTEIRSLEFELVVANDYDITVTSNKQVTLVGARRQSHLPVARAAGEVTDGSNQRFIRFAYGLPTAHEIVGVNFELTDLGGLDVRGEYAVNRRYRRFPNQNYMQLDSYRETDEAYYITAVYSKGPWFLYGEGYNIDGAYSTSAYIADADGVVDYHPRNEEKHIFEFVDDNDDQDEFPDWYRRNQSEGSVSVLGGARLRDLEVFPGLDQNNDFISDFNQNQNEIPDYAEPFLRYSVDPPEFLFGMDMNNNTIIDRFEDDDQPDFPYERDIRGANAYAGVRLARNTQLTVGRLRERQLSSARRSRMTYALVTSEWNLPGWRVVGYGQAKLVKDNIADDRLLWNDVLSAIVPFGDPLDLQDTFVGTGYVEGTFSGVDRLDASAKAKYERYRQSGQEADGIRRQDRWFLGLISRAGYRLALGKRLEIRPQWKSTFKREVPTLPADPDTRELTESFIMLGRYTILPRVHLDVGVERTYFANMLERPANPTADYAEDYQSWVGGFVLSNRSDYMGYTLTLTAGCQHERQDFSRTDDRAETTLYLELFAALGQ
jgi:hypothetical protein